MNNRSLKFENSYENIFYSSESSEKDFLKFLKNIKSAAYKIGHISPSTEVLISIGLYVSTLLANTGILAYKIIVNDPNPTDLFFVWTGGQGTSLALGAHAFLRSRKIK